MEVAWNQVILESDGLEWYQRDLKTEIFGTKNCTWAFHDE